LRFGAAPRRTSTSGLRPTSPTSAGSCAPG
jgi:hypothetical protein